MNFNPEIHRRRSIRMREYDYTHAGAYFVTLCVQNRKCLFGDVVDGVMRLNDAGRMVDEIWNEIPKHYPFVELDAHVVMPNHFHGILWIMDGAPVTKIRAHAGAHVGAQHAAPLPTQTPPPTTIQFIPPKRPHVIPGSLGAIVRSFKSAATRYLRIGKLTAGFGSDRPVWQRNYHEHVIRTQRSLDRIRRYIIDNPENWGRDRNNPARRG